MHKNNNLHTQKALAGAAIGAASGYSRNGEEGIATGALLGGVVGLVAGKSGVNAL